MNTAKWMRVKKKKSIRRIPLFSSSRVILEQLLEMHKLRVIKEKVPHTKDTYKIYRKVVAEDYDD